MAAETPSVELQCVNWPVVDTLCKSTGLPSGPVDYWTLGASVNAPVHGD